jgi:predicted transcriptional regulator
MGKVTAWLYHQPNRRAHLYALRKAGIVPGKATLDMALACLVEEGFVAREQTVRRGQESYDYVWLAAFRTEPDDDLPDLPNDLPTPA